MSNSETVTIIVSEPSDDISSSRSMIPNLSATSLQVVEVNKSTLGASLKQLLQDVNAMIKEAQADTDGPARIDEVTMTINVSKNGSIRWIASLGAQISGAMTVKFKVADMT